MIGTLREFWDKFAVGDYSTPVVIQRSGREYKIDEVTFDGTKYIVHVSEEPGEPIA